MGKTLSFTIVIGFAALLSVRVPEAQAQDQFPTRAITVIIPAPGGGPTDSGTRIVAQALSDLFGQPVVPDNRPGAATISGTTVVAKARPDGYTIGGLTNAGLTSAAGLGLQVPYNTDDFAPLGIIGFDSTVITVRADAPWKSLKDLIAEAKQHPKTLTYGAAGVGSMGWVGMEVVKHAFGIDITFVPYQGTGPTNTAVLGGHITIGAASLLSTLSLIKAGDLRPLAVTSAKRVGVLPEVPTVYELSQAETPSFWLGFFAPAKTPKPVLDKLTSALAKILKDPNVASQLEKAGFLLDYRDPAAVRKLMASEIKITAQLAKAIDSTK
jgi:tripartite-type tricarboxylate transporter receptor subunit TctC